MSEELPKNHPPIVSPEAWRAAREAMLVKEKAFTRARDAPSTRDTTALSSRAPFKSFVTVTSSFAIRGA